MSWHSNASILLASGGNSVTSSLVNGYTAAFEFKVSVAMAETLRPAGQSTYDRIQQSDHSPHPRPKTSRVMIMLIYQYPMGLFSAT